MGGGGWEARGRAERPSSRTAALGASDVADNSAAVESTIMDTCGWGRRGGAAGRSAEGFA